MEARFPTFVSIIMAALTCCQPEKSPVPAPDYFPIDSGLFRTFDVTRIKYSLTHLADTSTFTIRESMAESFSDASGQLVRKVNYFTQTAETQWRLDSLSVMWKSMDKAFAIESGKTIVKLTFPVYERNFWNGNAYNTMGENIFTTRNVNKFFESGILAFPKTVTVVRRNDSTLVRQIKHIETYAENVGLIRRELFYIYFCYAPDCVGKGKINSGFKETSIIKNFGR